MTAFTDWRRSCPFLGGVLTIAAGVELMVVVSVAPGLIRVIGAGAHLSWLFGVLLMVAGVTMLCQPALRYFAGSATLVLGLLSLVLANLGGFLLGAVLAVVGGALGVSWLRSPAVTESDDEQAASMSTQPFNGRDRGH